MVWSRRFDFGGRPEEDVENGEVRNLLRVLVHLTARAALPEEYVVSVVGGKASSKKHIRAYNLCDGTRSQGEIARLLKLDQGNFSRAVARWANAGVVFRIGSGREAKLLHAYPLSEK